MNVRNTVGRRGASVLVAAILLVVTQGCSSLPGFEHTETPDTTPPDVRQLVEHIQCELKEVLDDPDPALTPLRKELFVTYASLTLDVLVNQGFTPKLGFIHPLKADGTNRVIGLDSSFTGAQHRQVNQTFTLLLDPDYADPKKYPQFDKAKADACKPVEGPQGLRGRLGLKDLIVAGLRQFSQSDFLLPLGFGQRRGRARRSEQQPASELRRHDRVHARVWAGGGSQLDAGPFHRLRPGRLVA